MGPLVGMKAPYFTLKGSDGRTNSLTDYAGRTVVIGPEGTVLKQWWSEKKVAEHPPEVIEFLEAL